MPTWRLDDWMRPFRHGPSRPRARPPTVRDRRWAAGAAVVCLVLVLVAVALRGPARGLAVMAGLVGVGLVNAARVVALRHLGWRTPR